jgi:hypothetical protein
MKYNPIIKFPKGGWRQFYCGEMGNACFFIQFALLKRFKLQARLGYEH